MNRRCIPDANHFKWLTAKPCVSVALTSTKWCKTVDVTNRACPGDNYKVVNITLYDFKVTCGCFTGLVLDLDNKLCVLPTSCTYAPPINTYCSINNGGTVSIDYDVVDANGITSFCDFYTSCIDSSSPYSCIPQTALIKPLENGVCGPCASPNAFRDMGDLTSTCIACDVNL